MVTASVPGLVISTSKVKLPPGSLRTSGVAVFTTVITGGTSVMVMTASSSSTAYSPSSSTTLTVTTSRWVAPAWPLKVTVNEQL